MSTATIAAEPTATLSQISAAIYTAGVSRAIIEFDWPECHKKGCQARHGRPDEAFGNMKAVIARSLEDEMRWSKTTRADVAIEGDSDEDNAALILGVLLSRYTIGTTGGAGTFEKAARLIIDAYPGMVAALVAEQA